MQPYDDPDKLALDKKQTLKFKNTSWLFFFPAYKKTHHWLNLHKAIISTSNSSCHLCHQHSSDLSVHILNYKTIYNEIPLIDAIPICQLCLESLKPQGYHKNIKNKPVTVSFSAYEKYPKWKQLYSIIKTDSIHKIYSLIPKPIIINENMLD